MPVAYLQIITTLNIILFIIIIAHFWDFCTLSTLCEWTSALIYIETPAIWCNYSLVNLTGTYHILCVAWLLFLYYTSHTVLAKVTLCDQITTTISRLWSTCLRFALLMTAERFHIAPTHLPVVISLAVKLVHQPPSHLKSSHKHNLVATASLVSV